MTPSPARVQPRSLRRLLCRLAQRSSLPRRRLLPRLPRPRGRQPGTALAAVAGLTVKGRAPETGYSRSQFGQSWYDTDRNGCDTRNDILRRDLKSRQMKNACKVMAGTLAPDPYTGSFIRFVYGGASEVDIDHVVALSDAWQKGAPDGRRARGSPWPTTR